MSAPTPPPSGYSPYSAAPAAPTNTLAIVSLVLSALGLFTFVTAIAGVICGHISLGQIARSGEQGRSLALAGVITGYAVVGLGIIVAVISVIMFLWIFQVVATNPAVFVTPRP